MAYQSQNQLASISSFKSTINTPDMVKRMSSACGGKEEGKQFLASMLDLYENDKFLQDCDPQSVIAECLKAASLNLPLVKSLGYAYVVPFKNKNGIPVPTFIIGYKGLIQLALRSGQYRRLNSDCIYEGEEITFDRLSGALKISGERVSDTAIGYFAYFELINGFEKTFYMSVEQIIAYGKKYSRAYSKGPWQTDFDSMAKKTVIRQILKYGPMSTQMQQAERFETQSAEAAARAEISSNANAVMMPEPSVVIDSETGEVVNSPVMPDDPTTPPMDF